MLTTNLSPARESDRIENELRQLILTLELEPGMAISEATLMKDYGWGRTPLREAIQRLAQQSLLQIIPHQGIVVTALSVFDFGEMMDAMSMVIGPAAMLACERLTKEELEHLSEIVNASESAAKQGDFIKVSQLDFKFHRVLANATGNRHLSRYLLHLHQMATRFNFAGWKRDRNAAPSIDEHRQIIEILRQQDIAAAKSTMLMHVENARRRIVGTMMVTE